MKIDEVTLAKLFSYDLQGKWCIEICFEVIGDSEYDYCWMGKTPSDNDVHKDLYWFGLVPDGSQAYDFDSFDDMYHAPIFHGKSLQDVLERVKLLSVDGCLPEERLHVYS